ncbi:hypothetical protein ACWOUW_004244 [Vibrio vulnificus]
MTNLRSAIADWITIFTGLITIGSGLFALSQGVGESTETVGWMYYINHAVASLLSFITFVFFADQSIRISRQVVNSRRSVLPDWLIYIFCYIAGVLFFVLSQVLFQASVFSELYPIYIVIPLLVWFVITLVLLIQWGG